MKIKKKDKKKVEKWVKKLHWNYIIDVLNFDRAYLRYVQGIEKIYPHLSCVNCIYQEELK